VRRLLAELGLLLLLRLLLALEIAERDDLTGRRRLGAYGDGNRRLGLKRLMPFHYASSWVPSESRSRNRVIETPETG
jgi:hypothetical protein